MSKQILSIDADDQGRFFLSVETGSLTIGGTPANAEIVLHNLHIARIHCEVDVDEEPVVVTQLGTTDDEAAGQVPVHQVLRPGEALQFSRARLSLEGVAAKAAPVDLPLAADDELPGLVDDGPAPRAGLGPAATSSAAAPEQGTLIKQLVVIDGADKGRCFPLHGDGTVTVGKSRKHADITLNDLYVSRIHCELKIEGESVRVTHLEGQTGTLINGQRITQQELAVGDVLRVGNSQLRLQTGLAAKSSATTTLDDADDAIPELGDVDVIEDQGAEETFATPVEVVDEPAETGPDAAVAELFKLEDQDFGHFHIGPLLGRGQSGVVFRAEDRKNNRVVALKVHSPDFPKDDAELQHFVQALKVTPKFHHPHLVTLYGAGRTGRFCWIAREYVEGESLARLIQRLHKGEEVDWSRSCRVAVHLGKVLEFLHQHTVTHGNITPRNVLIRKSDKATKLADLMLSQALEGSRLMKAIVKKKLLAELSYLAPEQTDTEPFADPLTDLYELGTLLYALLMGRPPFTGDTSEEVLTRVREAKVARPSKHHDGIPAPFEAAVLKMMARRRADRYQSAAEMLEVVEAIARKHKIEA